MNGTVTINIEEYNRLRDRDILLGQMESKQIVVTESFWRGHVTTVIESKDEAIVILTDKLENANFHLQMATERYDELQSKCKSKGFFKTLFNL